MSEATPKKSGVRATEACKQGLHKMCDGTGIDFESGESVRCECPCHQGVGGPEPTEIVEDEAE